MLEGVLLLPLQRTPRPGMALPCCCTFTAVHYLKAVHSPPFSSLPFFYHRLSSRNTLSVVLGQSCKHFKASNTALLLCFHCFFSRIALPCYCAFTAFLPVLHCLTVVLSLPFLRLCVQCLSSQKGSPSPCRSSSARAASTSRPRWTLRRSRCSRPPPKSARVVVRAPRNQRDATWVEWKKV